VLTGTNVVLALTIGFIVVAGGIVVGAVALDRFVRTRQALEAAPPEPEEVEEEEEEVVAGIGIGRAGVPRWLYGFYVLIPLFSLLYVFNNVALRPAEEERPEATEAPTGPAEEWTIVSSGIKFDLDRIIVPAQTEVTVTFDNRDQGVPHNFTVWPDEQSAQGGNTAQALHAGNNISSGETEESFTSPDAGEYYFNCTVHPTSMFGTFEAVAG
jgi:plastocyanin